MPIDFPTSPTTGQVYTYQGRSWIYNGTAWDAPQALSQLGAVSVFANATARSSAIPTPNEGMVSYLNDVDRLEINNGSVWGPVSVASGGTGVTTLSSGGYLKGSGTAAITSQSGIPAGDITSGTFAAARIPGIETFSNTVSFVNSTATTYNAGTFYAGPTVSIDAASTASFLVQFTLQYGANAPWQRMSSVFTLVLVGWKASGVAGIQTTTLQHHNGDDLVLSYRTTVGESGNRTWGWSPSANLTVSSGATGVQILMKRIF